jgi:hypothetical protein
MVLGGLLGTGFLAAIGGCLLGAALVGEALARFGAPLDRLRARRKRRRSLELASKLDWSVIDNSLARERVQRDCERPETLGVCTGMECLVYKTCNFNIKKPLPGA